MIYTIRANFFIMKDEQNIVEIYNNITDLFLKYRLSDILNNYLNGDKESYDMFLMEAGYTCKITKIVKQNN